MIKKKIIFTTGSCDLFHFGHLNILLRAKSLGDYLIVFVDSDEKAIRKNGYSFMPQNERAEIIKAIKYVDEVVLINIPVSEAIKIYAKDCKYFTKGGDRTLDNLPKDEIEVIYRQTWPDVIFHNPKYIKVVPKDYLDDVLRYMGNTIRVAGSYNDDMDKEEQKKAFAQVKKILGIEDE